MSEAFIQEEKRTRSVETAVELNLRLFRSLPLFRKLFFLSLILIISSSAAPSVVRWYSGNYASGETNFTMGKLWALVGISIFCRIGAWMCFELSGMWSAQKIHSAMVKGLSNARTTYFDENPSGRLINRFIRDFDEVRGTAIIFAGDLFNAVIEIFSIAMVAAFANPLAIALTVPLFFIFFYVQYYRSSMLSHARRLSAVAMSNVLARENDLIEGQEIFLLYGKSSYLVKQMAKSFKTYAQAGIMMSKIEAWGSFWMRFTAEAFSFGVLLLLILALSHHQVDAAWTGVIISSLFGITGSIGWLDFATGLISRSVPHLERVFEIIDVPKEETEEFAKPLRGDQSADPTLNLDLVFKDYSMSYRKDSPLILQNLNLRFKTGTKTALIGRTGSGKSSLIQAIFRMVHVHSGNVYLQGESIYSMPVRDHRNRFAMIPQSPYLFEGSIRSNLDLSRKIPKDILKDALELVELKFPLDYKILEEGKNLSQGERQLVCLARAIVAKKEFLVLDEATSGLDPETDARMTRLLKRVFEGKTVITIAHRLNTIRDYDWVVELDQGKIIREGAPSMFLS